MPRNMTKYVFSCRDNLEKASGRFRLIVWSLQQEPGGP